MEVLAPLARWQEVYNQLGVRLWRSGPLVYVGRQTMRPPGSRAPSFTSACPPTAALPAPLPATNWQARYRDLEALRLEVDSRRRTVADLSHRWVGPQPVGRCS